MCIEERSIRNEVMHQRLLLDRDRGSGAVDNKENYISEL